MTRDDVDNILAPLVQLRWLDLDMDMDWRKLESPVPAQTHAAARAPRVLVAPEAQLSFTAQLHPCIVSAV